MSDRASASPGRKGRLAVVIAVVIVVGAALVVLLYGTPRVHGRISTEYMRVPPSFLVGDTVETEGQPEDILRVTVGRAHPGCSALTVLRTDGNEYMPSMLDTIRAQELVLHVRCRDRGPVGQWRVRFWEDTGSWHLTTVEERMPPVWRGLLSRSVPPAEQEAAGEAHGTR